MRFRRLAAAVSVLLPSWTAHACTVCDSTTGKQLRAGLFDGHFGHTLLLVIAPVPVLVVAVLLIHFGLPGIAVEEGEPATGLPSAANFETTGMPA